MASQRKRADRGTARGNGQDAGEEMQIWNTAQEDLRKIFRLTERADEARLEILSMEADFAAKAPESEYRCRNHVDELQ